MKAPNSGSSPDPWAKLISPFASVKYPSTEMDSNTRSFLMGISCSQAGLLLLSYILIVNGDRWVRRPPCNLRAKRAREAAGGARRASELRGAKAPQEPA